MAEDQGLCPPADLPPADAASPPADVAPPAQLGDEKRVDGPPAAAAPPPPLPLEDRDPLAGDDGVVRPDFSLPSAADSTFAKWVRFFFFIRSWSLLNKVVDPLPFLSS